MNAQLGKETKEPRLIWWLQDQERQNFGDYLTDFLWSNLACGMRIPGDGYRLLGSAISDGIVRDDLSKLGNWEHGRIVFWCCGMRDEAPLQPETRARSIFCGVRGPLTRAALKLPETTVMGDPGLLLPLLHRPQHAHRTAGKSICAPHFHESASDDQLQKLTGADVIVRPAIDRSPTALKLLLDEIATADFVLAGSLDAAIVACAYGVPFCYFDSDYIGVPLKWRDFSASVNIGTFFVDNVAEGRQTYEAAIRPRLRKPLLFPILAAAPFAVQTRYLLDAALLDSQQIGGDRQLAKEVLTSFAEAANNGIALFDRQSILAKLAEADQALTAEAEERLRVAQDLDKTFQRPWRPGIAWAQYLLLKSLAFASAPFSPCTSERFERSAQKRSPRRYKKMLANPVVASPTTKPAISSLLDTAGGKKSGATIFERRILVAYHRVPRADLSAGDKATVGLLKDLCALGFDVTFVSTDMRESPGYDEQLEALGVRVVNRGSGFQDAAHYIDAEGQSFGAFYLIRVDVAEAILPTARAVAPDAKILFHDPDLAFLREAREAEVTQDPAARGNADKMRDRELSVMRASDHVVIVSPDELPHLRAELPESAISVFPALYSEVEKDPPAYAGRRHVFFLGGFAHKPNVNAVLWFVDKVWPQIHKALPDVEFHIVGAEMPDEIRALGKIPGVTAVGFVRDLGPILKQMRVGVAPLLFGAGIKGKVGVTMGAGVPCVCTTIAAEGMGIVDGVHARVADDPGEFADAVVQLYNDEAAWQRMSDNGRALVNERFGEAANRSSFYSTLNAARCLPIPLFIQHCRNAAPSPLPVHDPALAPDVSIIIPVYNKWALTRACINSILITSAEGGLRYEILLADDGSTDETSRAAEIFPGLRIARPPQNLGFLRNCNHAAGFARGRYLLLLNNDTVVLPGWLKALYEAMESDPDIAIGGSKFLYADGTIQEAGGALCNDGRAVNVCRSEARDTPFSNIPREVDYISGASIIIRSDFWKAVGGFDERYKTAYCEDADLAMAARAEGRKVWYTPASEVIHFENQSYAGSTSNRAQELMAHNLGILRQKWRREFETLHLPIQQEWGVAAANAERHPLPSSMARREAGKFNILYFSPVPSHPANHGNQATIQQYGRRFQALGHKVHFALLRSRLYDDEALKAMEEAWDSFTLLDNSKTLGPNGQEIPFDDWYEPGLGEQIHALCATYDIDIVICSYVFQSKLLEFTPSYALKVIDTHDKMGGRYDMLRANGQPLEFFSCTPEEEGRYLRRADIVVARREEEARYFDSVTGRKSAIVIPHFEEPRFIDKTYRLFADIGTVASANQINLAIVKEFLTTLAKQCGGVCPFTVHIAGQVKDMVDGLPKAEARIFHASWVRFHGFVPDIGDFYRRMDAIVSPVTMGTGINVKTVQAMAYGMPLIATKWGTKGIETDNPMHNFEDMSSLVRGLCELAENPGGLNDLADVSRERYVRFYDAAGAAMASLFRHDKLTRPVRGPTAQDVSVAMTAVSEAAQSMDRGWRSASPAVLPTRLTTLDREC